MRETIKKQEGKMETKCLYFGERLEVRQNTITMPHLLVVRGDNTLRVIRVGKRVIFDYASPQGIVVATVSAKCPTGRAAATIVALTIQWGWQPSPPTVDGLREAIRLLAISCGLTEEAYKRIMKGNN